MTSTILQWTTIVIEFIGLLLITLELYFKPLSQELRAIFDNTKPKVIAKPIRWIGGYIILWVLAVLVLSMWEQSMGFTANIIFSVFITLVLLLIAISKSLIRLGVMIGKGNSVGGVGLVLALIGLSLEIGQMI
ncbi:hypothetical protein PN836_006375 [Ningiella sp. W23]|uniref:hypothetical protein n=1 Tax=Ningiella sp. W23 TaxID=3023715 RepID=UPI0037581A15